MISGVYQVYHSIRSDGIPALILESPFYEVITELFTRRPIPGSQPRKREVAGVPMLPRSFPICSAARKERNNSKSSHKLFVQLMEFLCLKRRGEIIHPVARG